MQKQKMYALRVRGRRHDVGSRLSFLKTTLEFAWEEEQTRKILQDFLRDKKNIL